MGKRIKDLTSLSLPINNNDKIIIERSDKSYNANISDILSTKQDTISDLDTIRSCATLGATALQAVPSEYVTESELEAKKYLTAIPSEYVTETELTNKKFAKASELDALEAAVGTGFTSTNTVASAIAAKQTAIDTEVTNRTQAVSDAKTELLGGATTDYNTLGKLENKVIAVSRNVTTIQNSVGENTSSKTLSERVNILENKCDKIDSKANVLWVGTSIPAGDIQFSNNGTTQSTTSDLGSNNYPKMVADALGFNLYNNSRGSSFVCFYPSSDDGTSNWAGKQYTEYQNEVYKGYSLSASMAQVEEKFGPNGLNVPVWLLNSFKSYSYESLIIPYIDGTIASCDTVIIDHGYNDRQQILNETSWHKGEGEEMVIGSGRDWLLTLQDPFEKTQTTESHFQSCWWANENDKETKKYYWKAIIFLCKKIWNVNPRIQIIIGNYFTKKSDIFGSEFQNDRLGEFICLANTAIANWLQVKCVNVANYTGLYNRNLAAGRDFQIFCPDNVHPHSDSSGRSNQIIARIYINQLRGLV